MSTPTTSIPPSSASVCSLLTWRDPIFTGSVFGGILTTLIVLKFVNLFNVFFHLSYLGLLGMYTQSAALVAPNQLGEQCESHNGIAQWYRGDLPESSKCRARNALVPLAILR
jgi:hypothetical protein